MASVTTLGSAIQRRAGGNSAHVMIYDMDWNVHPEFSVFNSDYLKGEIIPKPKNFDKIWRLQRNFQKGFPELRVDLPTTSMVKFTLVS